MTGKQTGLPIWHNFLFEGNFLTSIFNGRNVCRYFASSFVTKSFDERNFIRDFINFVQLQQKISQDFRS